MRLEKKRGKLLIQMPFTRTKCLCSDVFWCSTKQHNRHSRSKTAYYIVEVQSFVLVTTEFLVISLTRDDETKTNELRFSPTYPESLVKREHEPMTVWVG